MFQVTNRNATVYTQQQGKIAFAIMLPKTPYPLFLKDRLLSWLGISFNADMPLYCIKKIFLTNIFLSKFTIFFLTTLFPGDLFPSK